MRTRTLMFVLIVGAAALLGCAGGQLFKKSVLVERGQSKNEVVALLGPPENRQFQGADEAWQYCETGAFAGDYIIVWFYTGKVTGVTTYQDSRPGPPCSAWFRTIRWEEAPDRTIEIRRR